MKTAIKESFLRNFWLIQDIEYEKTHPFKDMIQFSYPDLDETPKRLRVTKNDEPVHILHRSRTKSLIWDNIPIHRHYFWVEAASNDVLKFWIGRKKVSVKGNRQTPRIARCRKKEGWTHASNLSFHAYSNSAKQEVGGDYHNSWLFMDHDQRAGDNAEHLYRYISKNEYEKAYFIMSKDALDWHRLESEGFKLIEYGSEDHRAALLSARYLISSHADNSVIKPFGDQWPAENGLNFVFLQHGVIQSDLSDWLNEKPIDVFISSTINEYFSIVSPDSPYKYSEADTFLLGMPRHDALKKGNNNRKKIILAPTWRKEFVTGQGMRGMKKKRKGEFFKSKYFADWNDIINSVMLRNFAVRNDLDIVFAPHPNMSIYLDEFSFPEHVYVFGRNRLDNYTDLFSAAYLAITDYSSIAFDAAFSGAQIIYFQPDKSRFFQPGYHVGRKGYFDYETHGFGPVVEGIAELIDTLNWLELKKEFPQTSRVSEQFPFRDGKNCARIYRILARD